MSTRRLNVVVHHLLADLRPEVGDVADAELLARFVRSRDGDALAALVRRHTPMVWGVCRRLLHNHHHAEDAFQATFLVLVRKAADVPRQAVANWLYGVARQTAVRVRATVAKQGRRETQVATMPEPVVAEDREAGWLAVLDEELSRLPDRYRKVIVLCELEGMTRKEAARQLAVPEGSVGSRLARARAMLAKRLARRGVVAPSGAMATALSAEGASASTPPVPVAVTISIVTSYAAGQVVGVIPEHVAALAEGVLRIMMMTKLKTVLLGVVVTALACIGASGLLHKTAAAQPPAGTSATAPQAEPQPLPSGPADPTTRVGGVAATTLMDDRLSSYNPDQVVAQLRSRYVKLNEELVNHLTAPQVKQRVEELEKELAAAKERERKAIQEQKADAEMAKVRARLADIAKTYEGTETGAKAVQALEVTRPPQPAGFEPGPPAELTPRK